MVGAAVRSLLVNAGTIEPLVGLDGNNRVKIYPLIVPQGVVYPAIVYQVVSANPIYCHTPGGATADEYRVQVSVFDTSYLALENLARAIRLVLEDYAGTSETEKITKVLLDNQRDRYEEDSRLYHRAMDFRLFVHNN